MKWKLRIEIVFVFSFFAFSVFCFTLLSCMKLDFSKLEGAKGCEKYEIFKDIMENDAVLVDVNYIQKVVIRVNDKEWFYFITCTKYAHVEDNINEIGSCIFKFFRKYEYAKLKKMPKSALIDDILAWYKDIVSKEIKVYGPCALIPCKLLEIKD